MKKGMMVMLGLIMSIVVLGSCGHVEEPIYTNSIVDEMTTTDEEVTTNIEVFISESSSKKELSSITKSSSKAATESSSKVESSAAAREIEIVEDNSKAISTIPQTIEITENTEKSVIAEDDFVGPTQELEIVENTQEVGPSITEAPVEVQETKKVEPVKEVYVVFKPSTHYVHKSDCHWVDDTCYKIENTNDIEAIKCTECNPDIEIVKEYEEPKPAVADIDSYSRQLLAEIVWHEAGSEWISQYEKARVAAGVMNRVNDSRFPNTVYDVLVAPGQFTGYWPGCCSPTQACYDAVDYYFANPGNFGNENSWYGTGYQNIFYYQ